MAVTGLRAGGEVSGWTDAELVRAGGLGHRDVFVELYRRHFEVARRAARGVTSDDDDAADAAAEAFARVFDAIVSGRAPAMEFRAYLITASRNAAVDQRRRSGPRAAEGADRAAGRSEGAAGDGAASGPGPSDAVAATEDSKLVVEAFRALPARWQSVLWLTEVDGLPPREAAGILGVSPNNVAQLAVRARARLRERYLQAHVRNHAGPRCQGTVDHLGGYLAGTLTDSRRARVAAHLAECGDCRDRLAEVEDLGVPLRRALAGVPLLSLGWLRRHSQRRIRHDGAGRPGAAPAELPEAPGVADRAAVAVSGSPMVQSLASLPVSAAASLVAVGASARWAIRGAVAVLAALPLLSGVGDARRGPVAVAVASSVQPGAALAAARNTPPTVPAPPPAPEPPVAPAPPPLPTATHPFTTVAQAIGPVLDVFDADGATVVDAFDNPIPSGAPLVFVVVEEQPQWLRVLLPVRPNGSTGWVRRQDVTLTTHTFSIVIELGAHRITAFNGTEPFLSEPVAVGTSDTPTPGGEYYTKELIQPVNSRGRVDPTGPYGPYAYGLSGYSEVLTEFAGGDGVLGIHGTNDPSALGHDVSHGCIRMSNDGITTLAGILPLGVPVDIRP